MRLLTRYEAIGIALSIAVAVCVLALFRFLPLSDGLSSETHQGADVVIVEDASDATLAHAIAEASTNTGRITKLVVQDVVPGTGRTVRVGDTVTIHYIGVVQGGTEFANTHASGSPYTFTVGAGEAIEGLERGVLDLKEGGQRILVIPATMAYGSTAVGPVPADATLLFSLELLSLE